MLDNLKYTAILCNECNEVLDVLSGVISPLYIEKKCKCGSVGFYTQVIKVNVVCNRPTDQKLFFQWNGQEFYK